MDPRIKASRSQEKRLAQKLGGTTVAGSGSGWAVKNDVRTDVWSVECKTTTKASYTLTHASLLNAEKNAILDMREMAFAIEMKGRNWIVVSEDNFLRLTAKER